MIAHEYYKSYYKFMDGLSNKVYGKSERKLIAAKDRKNRNRKNKIKKQSRKKNR